VTLSWKVLREDFNKGTIEYYDIFKGGHWQEIIESLMHSCKSKEEFSAELRKKLMYQYWSRSEYEVVVTSWPPYIKVENIEEMKSEVEKHNSECNWEQVRISPTLTVAKKIDVFEQLNMNWEQFINYVWENA
jgi:hypothetical protein